jgi:hypothetical protein
MTTFAGLSALWVKSAQVAGVSQDLNTMEAPASGPVGIRLELDVVNTQDSDGKWQHTVQFQSWRENGGQAITNNIWDKIIIIPTQRNFGSVLSIKTFSVEVWSTFRNNYKTLTAVDISGSGNLAISSPETIPTPFAPLGSVTYPCTLPTLGDPLINNFCAFTFPGYGQVVFNVVGSRVMVFWPRMDWSERFKESMEWYTEILTSYSGCEQRIQHRTKPRYSVSYRVLTLDQYQTALLENQLFCSQANIWGVPWWPEAVLTTSEAIQGSTTISVQTALSPSFEDGGLALLYLDSRTFEAVPITFVNSDHLSLSVGLANTWPINSRIIPMRRGYMTSSLPVNRPTNWLSAAEFSFSCEAIL